MPGNEGRVNSELLEHSIYTLCADLSIHYCQRYTVTNHWIRLSS